MSHIEVDDQAERVTSHLQVRPQLGDVHRVDAGDGFDLDNHRIAHDIVDPEEAPKRATMTHDGEVQLVLVLQAQDRQLISEGDVVRFLGKPRTHVGMHGHPSTDDQVAQVVDRHGFASALCASALCASALCASASSASLCVLVSDQFLCP
jgi:hypothetical protein